MDFFVRTFIVVEPDPIVSMDLAGILKTGFPKCRVTLLQREIEAAVQIAAIPEPVCVILNSILVTENMLSALRTCTQNGGQVVFIGPVDGVDFPAKFVGVPFTSSMVLDALSE